MAVVVCECVVGSVVFVVVLADGGIEHAQALDGMETEFLLHPNPARSRVFPCA